MKIIKRVAIGRVFSLLVVSLAFETLAEDMILIDSKIDGQDAHLAFGTGSEMTVLFDRAADRLGISWSPPSEGSPPIPGKVSFGRSEECELLIGRQSARFRFGIVEIPPYLKPGFDGVLSWDTLHAPYIRIDASRRSILFPSQDGVLNVKGCQEWRILNDFRILVINTSPQGEIGNSVFIDTGRPDGVLLPRRQWEEWKRHRKDRKQTLDAGVVPGLGFVVTELYWAEEIRIGDLTIRNVPVGCAPDSIAKKFPNFGGILGLNALRGLDVVIERDRDRIFTRDAVGDSAPFAYNRLGAVFVPQPDSGDDLVAEVVSDGPAYRAGIRNGDRLLRIGEIDVTKWREDPNSRPGGRFWNKPAGTEFELQLQRETEDFGVTVTLEEIFPIDSPDNKSE